jgi:uncharacterized protein YjbJ (UPF0337 family)
VAVQGLAPGHFPQSRKDNGRLGVRSRSHAGRDLSAQAACLPEQNDSFRGLPAKSREHAGKLVGSKKPQIKGLSKQISVKVQKGVGDVEQSVEDFDKR